MIPHAPNHIVCITACSALDDMNCIYSELNITPGTAIGETQSTGSAGKLENSIDD